MIPGCAINGDFAASIMGLYILREYCIRVYYHADIYVSK